MKNSLLLITALFISGMAYSQSPNYDDLKILYADANYEKLAKVAAGYTEKDKTKKDIAPYIWLSKGLYKISLSGTENLKTRIKMRSNIYRKELNMTSNTMKGQQLQSIKSLSINFN